MQPDDRHSTVAEAVGFDANGRVAGRIRHGKLRFDAALTHHLADELVYLLFLAHKPVLLIAEHVSLHQNGAAFPEARRGEQVREAGPGKSSAVLVKCARLAVGDKGPA